MVRGNFGEFAHNIGDSPAAARGIPGESERLAADPDNLLLVCYDCHNRIDLNGKDNPYPADQLRAMKQEHEARIEIIYSATGAKKSLPILMSFPVGNHIPVIEIHQIHNAILENSGYSCSPLGRSIHIDRNDFDVQDDTADFWPRAEQSLKSLYETRIRPELTARNGASHLTIAAFAPIPMLMKLGSLVGDKTETMVLDLPAERWLWDRSTQSGTPEFEYKVPERLSRVVSVAVSISNRIVLPEGNEIVEFRAKEPNRGIIRTEAHMQVFRREFNAFLMALVRGGAGVIHIYPATPLGASIAIGQIILPKAFEEIHVWEWQAPKWRPAIRLK